jgi:DNA polymerase elongation subunit (family B)
MKTEEFPNILIFDIETVKKHPTFAIFADKQPHLSDLYLKRFRKYLDKSDVITVEEHYDQKTALFAEFAQVICFSMSWLVNENGQWVKKEYCYYNTDEVELLRHFETAMNGFAKKRNNKIILAGFNHSNFDIPFMSKRYLYNGLKIPNHLNFYGKKPWEMDVLDISEFLRFKQFQDSYMSLELTCELFGLDNPKNILGGANLGPLYFNEEVSPEEKSKRIKEYCMADSIAVADLIVRIFG